MPADFQYRDVFLKGKPEHDRYDSFRIKHPRMNVGHRAKIFAPFDALKGFSDAVSSKDILYEDRKDLAQEDREEIDRRLHILHNLTWNGRIARTNQVQISVTYYVPCTDENSEAYGYRGQYQTITGICWKVDPEVGRTILVDKATIEIEDVLRIESTDGIFSESWDFPDG